jgi:hypothetical protein
MERIIVRRGRFLTFELLRRTFGGDPNVEIIWDRRKAVAPPENRGPAERRSRPPIEWYRLDYLFTSGTRGHARASVPTAPLDPPPS